MKNLFDEVRSLDERCYKEFGLNEDILMEHAGDGMADYIRSHFDNDKKILVVCGSSNNGADGIALARLLHKDFNVNIFYVKEPKSPMAKLQAKRAKAIKVPIIQNIQDCDILVDAIVGTGFKGEFNGELLSILKEMNALSAYKIACDVPSGNIFKADITLTMGALKKSMFLDHVKDVVGEIKVLDLGISREIYEKQRDKKDSHKGTYGHLAVACGSKSGASIISAKSALRFGAGLVSLVGFENISVPYSIMYTHELPYNTTALALGMGLGSDFSKKELDKFLDNNLPMVADADIFYMDILVDILKRENVVITPHAKEFVSVLKLCKLADISVEELQKERFMYAELFCKTYPNITLLLKGANVIIGHKNHFFINPYGTLALAKGGSGDVLSGLIGSLLAQGNSSLDSAINASLTHIKLSLEYKKNNFSLTPEDLIKGLKDIQL